MDIFFEWLAVVLKAFEPDHILETFGFAAFVQPNTRVYYPYLLFALIIAVSYYFFKKRSSSPKSVSKALKYLFPKAIWLHQSAIVDYQLFIINSLFKGLLIIPFLITNLAFAYIVISWWESVIGMQDRLQWSTLSISICYTIVFMLVSDFSRFILHYSLHKVPLLWQFHKVHHSAEVLTPMTLHRIHPIEYYLFKLRGLFVFGLVAGSFSFWFRTGLEPITILQIHMDLFLFNLLGANLRHSHIPISYGRILEYIFISPTQHQIHHGSHPRFFDKNFGSLFAFWDWLFGSLIISDPKEKISFGIEKEEQPKFQTLWQVLSMPFRRKQ
jgi:sterol desaturase/sphingolipid hydroxylase (fatty acid hydroxylase superfamily)